MIKVIVKYEHQVVHSLQVKGHAKSAEYGHDLVCAGVSSIVTGALNALSQENFSIKLNEGLMMLDAVANVNQHDAVVLETLVTQLRTMEESYPQFIKIIL